MDLFMDVENTLLGGKLLEALLLEQFKSKKKTV